MRWNSGHALEYAGIRACAGMRWNSSMRRNALEFRHALEGAGIRACAGMRWNSGMRWNALEFRHALECAGIRACAGMRWNSGMRGNALEFGHALECVGFGACVLKFVRVIICVKMVMAVGYKKFGDNHVSHNGSDMPHVSARLFHL